VLGEHRGRPRAWDPKVKFGFKSTLELELALALELGDVFFLGALSG
jgi:hypothetical protein